MLCRHVNFHLAWLLLYTLKPVMVQYLLTFTMILRLICLQELLFFYIYIYLVTQEQIDLTLPL